jgi:hypothetical protein
VDAEACALLCHPYWQDSALVFPAVWDVRERLGMEMEAQERTPRMDAGSSRE